MYYKYKSLKNWSATDYVAAAQIELEHIELERGAEKMIAEAIAGKLINVKLEDIVNALSGKLVSPRWGKPTIHYRAKDRCWGKEKYIECKWWSKTNRDIVPPPTVYIYLNNLDHLAKRVPQDLYNEIAEEKYNARKDSIHKSLQTFTEDYAQMITLRKYEAELARRMRAVTDLGGYGTEPDYLSK